MTAQIHPAGRAVLAEKPRAIAYVGGASAQPLAPARVAEAFLDHLRAPRHKNGER